MSFKSLFHTIVVVGSISTVLSLGMPIETAFAKKSGMGKKSGMAKKKKNRKANKGPELTENQASLLTVDPRLKGKEKRQAVREAATQLGIKGGKKKLKKSPQRKINKKLSKAVKRNSDQLTANEKREIKIYQKQDKKHKKKLKKLRAKREQLLKKEDDFGGLAKPISKIPGVGKPAARIGGKISKNVGLGKAASYERKRKGSTSKLIQVQRKIDRTKQARRQNARNAILTTSKLSTNQHQASDTEDGYSVSSQIEQKGLRFEKARLKKKANRIKNRGNVSKKQKNKLKERRQEYKIRRDTFYSSVEESNDELQTGDYSALKKKQNRLSKKLKKSGDGKNTRKQRRKLRKTTHEINQRLIERDLATRGQSTSSSSAFTAQPSPEANPPQTGTRPQEVADPVQVPVPAPKPPAIIPVSPDPVPLTPVPPVAQPDPVEVDDDDDEDDEAFGPSAPPPVFTNPLAR